MEVVSDQIGKSHLTITALGHASAHELARPRNDRESHRERLVTGIAAAEKWRIENHVGHHQKAKELRLRNARHENHAPRYIGKCFCDARAEQPVPVLVNSGQQQKTRPGIAPQQGGEDHIEIRMQLEQALRTQVERRVIGKSEFRVR